MAGCECEKETWKLSYENEVAAVSLANPALTPHDIRVEAARIFRPRYKSDIESKANEQSGLTEYDTGVTFTMTDDGKLIYTNKGYEGVEIEDFSLNQLKLTPQQYSLREHQTSLGIREAFRGGATNVVTSYIRQGQDNRDIVEMRYDPETKVGHLFIRNTKSDGQNHDVETIRDIAKQEFSTLRETNIAPDVFILSDKPISNNRTSEAVTRIDRSFLQDKQQLRRPEPIGDIAKTTEHIIAKTLQETKEAGAALPTFVAREIFHKKKKLVEQFPIVPHLDRIKLKYVGAEKTAYISQIAKKLEKKIIRKLNKQRLSTKQRVVAAEGRVEMKFAPVRLPEMVMKTAQMKTERTQKMTRKAEKKYIFNEIISFKGHKKEKETNIKKLVKQERKMIQDGRQERNVRMPMKENHLLRQLVRLIRKLEQPKRRKTDIKEQIIQKKVIKMVEQREKVIKKEMRRETVLRFTSALTIWVVLKRFEKFLNRPDRLIRQDFQAKRFHESIHESSLKTHGDKETLPKLVASPWILLSIIWYLAAIREQGMQKKKTKIKKVKKQSPLPQNGIIFAASS